MRVINNNQLLTLLISLMLASIVGLLSAFNYFLLIAISGLVLCFTLAVFLLMMKNKK